MSLDVSLTITQDMNEWEKKRERSLTEAGEMKGLIPLVKEYYADRKPIPTEVFSANITHNLNDMAMAVGIYMHVWRPEEIGITHAKQLIEPLTKGLKKMKDNPDKFKQLDSPNGWGTYKDFVPWLEDYLNACIEYPDAEISVSR